MKAFFVRYLMILALLIGAVGMAEAQQYVFLYKNGNTYNFMYNNSGSIGNTTTFNANTCVWTGTGTTSSTFTNNGSSLNRNNSTLRINTASTFVITTYGRVYYDASTDRYIQYSSGWTTMAQNNNPGTGAQYTVLYTYTTQEASLSDPVITGNGSLTATGSFNYSVSATGAPAHSQFSGYNSTTAVTYYYYNSAMSTQAPSSNVTSGTWSLDANGADASVNTSTGAITVNSLPATDITMTLTCSVTSNGITKTATKEVTLQGTKPSAPIISVNGTTVTLSTTAAGSTTIRYTLDGTDPTASTGTVYSGAIDLSGSSTSPVTIKAVTVRNGNASDVSTEIVTLTLPTPTITINGGAQTATITSSIANATIYYTTDGTTPTTSSSQYTGALTGLAYMTNVKAIAVKDGWNNSPVASGIVTIPSGVSGGVVTLFDYEPHSWSYYSDPDCPIRSLNPADVKITYYGNGQTANNMTTDDNGDNPNTFGAKATGVQVSATETENTFVYYKTLERNDGATAASVDVATGYLKYTTIPNPFQVRPTNGSGSASTTRSVYISWSCGTWYYSQYAQVYFVYTNASGTQTTSSTYQSNGNATITAKVGTTITLYARRSRNNNNATYSPTITARYDDGDNSQIVTHTATATSFSNAAGTIAELVDVTIMRGFYTWRIKSLSDGLSIVGHAVGDTVHADSPIQFSTSSSTGNEVEFEALWAKAYVTTGTTAMGSYVPASVTSAYERNFHVVTTETTAGSYNQSYPHTVTAYYPNGTPAGGSISGAFTAAADTKFEDIEITGATNSTWTAANHDLIIGRGCSGTINYVRGVGGDATAPNYTLRIESGTINYLSFLKGYWTGSNSYTDNGSTMSGNVDLRCVLGCDYDRASNDGVTNNLIINNNVILGAQNTIADANKHRKTTNLIVKSGKIGNSININSNDSYMADAYQSIYMSVSNSQQTIGQRKVLVEGGEIIGIAGGIDAHYLGTGVTNNNVTGIPTPHTEEPSFSVRMTGGKVRGCVYGGAAKSPASGNRRMVFTGGTINGWVGCGCNGTEDDGGKTYGESFLYFGGETRCEADPSHDFTMNGTKGGYVFGAGKGYAGGTGTSGEMTYGTNVAIADNSYVQRDVFGGGNYGYALESTNVYVCGGTVHGNAFGGSNLKNGPVVNVKMIGGLIEGGLYGGSNETGNISGNVTVQIDGGQVGTPSQNANVHGGGLGNATRTLNNVYVNIGSRTDCNVSGSAVIYGDVYGGSAEGKTNGNTARENNSVTNVTFNKGTIYGSLYGGGLGSASYAADVYGPVAVKVYGGTLTGGVYGANNVKGAPQNSVTVDIYGTDAQPGVGYAIANVYGGGNQAAYNNANYPTVTIHDHNNVASKMSIGNVYGGGNAAAVTNTKVTVFGGDRIGAVYAGGNGTGVATTFQMVTGDANAYICGGTIERVFAGNNSSGIVNGTKYVRINADSTEAADVANCISGTHRPMMIGSVFQGGNQANGSPGTVKIVCTGLTTDEYIDTLFGGANNANIVNNDMSTAADVTLNIDRGHIRTGIFGGNNSGGNITGDIEINLTRNSSDACVFPFPSVFGGGFGAATTTGGDITLNIGEKDEASTAPTIAATIEGGAIYGGSALGSVNGSSSDKTEINIYNCTITTGNIYGGGLGESDNANKGKVNGDITVNISTEDQDASDCVTDIHTSSIYGCNNTGGSPQGNVTVHVWKTGLTTGNYSSASTGTLYAIDQVFGGGNEADYAPENGNANSTKKATVYVHDCLNTIRRVFGGGNAAAAKGVVTTIDGGRYDYIFGGGNGEVTAANIGSGGTNLTVNAGRINHLFGGSNERGSIAGPMRTNVNYSKLGTDGCDELIIEFFGGGNLAPIGSEGNPVNLSTTIECNTIFSAVYGGSNLADIYGDVTLTINGGTIIEAYGGSKGRLADNSDPEHPITAKAANIHGNVKLNIYGGDIGRAYGGSNINGNITGAIGVDLDWKGDCPGKSVDYIYGGSNQAAYTPTASGALSPNFSPTVKLINGVVNYNVYGGGRGGSATVTANPKVIAGDGTTPTNSANVQGDIFGGGDAANVTGKTNVRVVHNSKVGGNVFGGGNAAEVSQDTEVEIKDQARIGGNVYGGGNEGAIGGNTKVIINSSK